MSLTPEQRQAIADACVEHDPMGAEDLSYWIERVVAPIIEAPWRARVETLEAALDVANSRDYWRGVDRG